MRWQRRCGPRKHKNFFDGRLGANPGNQLAADHARASGDENGFPHQCSIKVAAQWAPKPKLNKRNLSPCFNEPEAVASLRLIQLSAAITWPFCAMFSAKNWSCVKPSRSKRISQLRRETLCGS